MKNSILLTIFCVLILLSGCSSKIFNPYESEFRCQSKDNDGKCVSTKTAYNESINPGQTSEEYEDDDEAGEEKEEKDKSEKGKKKRIKKTPSPQEVYNKNRFALMTELVKEPQPPVVVPPEVVRILILPYTGDDNNMYGFRYSFFFATQPKWQFSIGREGE